MDRVTGLEVFIAIVDSGGFSRAAGRLNMSPAMVSTHLARLEDRLGAKLMERTTRRLDLTPQGRQFLDEARAVLALLSQAETAVRRGAGGPSGRVLIDAPGAVGLRFVVPALPALRALHPHVVIDLSVGDRGTAFRTDGFDLLIRMGLPNEGKGHILPLGETRFLQIGFAGIFGTSWRTQDARRATGTRSRHLCDCGQPGRSPLALLEGW